MSAALLHLSPDAALTLFTVGVLFIYVELNRPGTILAGALGLIAVLLAAANFSHSPINLVSILLILCGCALFIRSIRRNTHSLLYALATAFFLVGFLRLITKPGIPHIHAFSAVLCALLLGISTTFLTRIARRARRNKGLD